MIQNPILPGFCPDPSIIRVGDDYYIANSSFEWWPGVKIYHSKDLKHYEQLPSPLTRMSQLNMVGEPDSCGVWAPDISWDGEYFWLIYTDVKTRTSGFFNTHNYVVKSKDIRGGWSEPVYLNSSGFDPSLFHDTDGKKYVVNMINNFKGILVQEYDPVQECLVGEAKNVFPGTQILYALRMGSGTWCIYAQDHPKEPASASLAARPQFRKWCGTKMAGCAWPAAEGLANGRRKNRRELQNIFSRRKRGRIMGEMTLGEFWMCATHLCASLMTATQV